VAGKIPSKASTIYAVIGAPVLRLTLPFRPPPRLAGTLSNLPRITIRGVSELKEF